MWICKWGSLWRLLCVKICASHSFQNDILQTNHAKSEGKWPEFLETEKGHVLARNNSDRKLNQANKEKDCSVLPSRSETDLFRRKNSHVERQFVDTLDWRCGQNSLGGYIYIYMYIHIYIRKTKLKKVVLVTNTVKGCFSVLGRHT